MGILRQEYCHALLQGIFPTQGLNPGLLHCKQILYQLSYQESFPPTPTPPKMVPMIIFIMNKLLSQIGCLQQVRIKMLLKINN